MGNRRGQLRASVWALGWTRMLVPTWRPEAAPTSTEAGARRTQRPARALALTVRDGALLSWHIQGTWFKWRHLCCCHKGGAVLSCSSAQTPARWTEPAGGAVPGCRLHNSAEPPDSGFRGYYVAVTPHCPSQEAPQAPEPARPCPELIRRGYHLPSNAGPQWPRVLPGPGLCPVSDCVPGQAPEFSHRHNWW